MPPVTPAQLQTMIEKKPLGPTPPDRVQMRDGVPIRWGD